MKGFVLIISIILTGRTAEAQVHPLSVGDFESLVSLNYKRTSSFLEQKGFRVAPGFSYNASAFIYNPKSQGKADSVYRAVTDFERQKDNSFIYKTGSRPEYQAILSELRSNNFWESEKENGSLYFQRKDISIWVSAVQEDSSSLYEFKVLRSALPALSSVRYAEDLARFDSHEHLASVFGEVNTVRDSYYLDEKNARKCTVLFPNSSRQVIFIWKNQETMAGLAYIMVGGSLRTNGSKVFNQSLPLSDWQFECGVRIGMTLEEVRKLNEKDFEVFGKLSEFQGAVVPSSNGAIDFRKTGLQFQCLNCYSGSITNSEKIKASAAIGEGLQMHLVSVLIMPDAAEAK